MMMDSDVNIVEFLENLQGNKPPFECPFEDCKKICKTHKSIENHINSQHKPPDQEIVLTPNEFSSTNVDSETNSERVSVKDRISSTPAIKCSVERRNSWLSSPSPLGPIRKRKSSTTSLSSSNRVFTHREQMSYADSRKFVMLEADGRTYRHNIHTAIEMIEDASTPPEDDQSASSSTQIDASSSNEPSLDFAPPLKNGFIRKSLKGGRPNIATQFRQSRLLKNKKCQSTEALLSRLPKLSPPLNIPVAKNIVVTKTPQPQYRESSDFPVLNKSVTKDQSAYVHYIEKTPEELEELVEYDLDEEDLLWLERVNQERSQKRLQAIDQHTMELVIDRFEKLAYFRSSNGLLDNTDEDAVCSVCLDGTCENTNAILFCDVCNLAVHQECYGVPYIPEGQWLCRKCIHSPSEPVNCVLCPNAGGAFKKTTDDRWSHVICALWVPEVMFVNLTFLEPIEHIEKIAPARWRLQCYICKQRNAGACIQCHKTSCYIAFHVTCAQQAGLYMKIEHLGGEPPGRIRKSAFCDIHAPPGHFKNSGMYAHSPNPDESEELKKKHLKNTRKILAERRNSKPNILLPVIPSDKFQNVIDGLSVSDKKNFVIRLHSFWKLKREFRRGVPLLKRLQVAGSRNVVEIASCDQETKQLREQMKFWQRLRQDLEKARLLSELIRKRERLKREIFRLYAMTTELKMQPFVCFLRRILDQLQDFDRGSVFAQPVKEKNAPGYFSQIKQPMDLSTMHRKVHNHEYTGLTGLEQDFNLMIKNCCSYNPTESSYHKLALKFEEFASPIFKEAHFMIDKIGFDTQLGVHLSDLSVSGDERKMEDVAPFTSSRHNPPSEELELKIFLDDELLKALPAADRHNVTPNLQFKLLTEKVAQHSSQSHTTRDQREKMRELRNSLQGLRDYYQLDNDGRSLITKSSTSSPSKISSSESCTQFLSQISPSIKSESGKRKFSRLRSYESPKSFRSRNYSIQEEDVSFVKPELFTTSEKEQMNTSLRAGISFRVGRRTRSSRNNGSDCNNPDHMDNSTTVADSTGKLNSGETSPELRHRATRFSSPETARCTLNSSLTSPHLSRDCEHIHLTGSSTASSLCDHRGGGGCSSAVKSTKSPPVFNNHCGAARNGNDDGDRLSSATAAFTNYRSCRARDIDDDDAEDGAPEDDDDENDEKIRQPSLKRKRLLSTESKRSARNQQSPGSCSSVGSPLGLGFSEFGERYEGSDTEQDDDENIQLEPLDLVWAKCRGYPWYPGLIIDPFMPREGYTHNGVPIPVPPESVLSVGRDSKEQHFLVLFFDVKRTWQWLAPEKLEPLGVDPDLDRDKLLEAKKTRLNNSIRKAYSAAIEHLCKVNGRPYPHSENGNS